MKKYIIFTFLILFLPLTVFGLDINSKYVYFYNIDRDNVIYELNSTDEISIASMTKIMTAIVAIENIDDLDATVTLTSNDFKGLKEANASTAGFKTGEVVTYRDLLYGLMLPSGADAALALSNNIAGSEKKYVELMNQKAEELNLENTHFSNTTGLDAKDHYSSVYDVSIILKYALNNEEFKEIFTTKKYVTSNKRMTFESTLYSMSKRNKLDTEYILGSKSGYTYDAGLCLASIAEYNGEVYLLVTAGADYKSKKPYHILDSHEIYQYYFNNYSYKTVMKKGDSILTLTKEDGSSIEIFADDTLEYYLNNDANVEVKYDGITELTNDLKKGDYLGLYSIYADDKLLYSKEIFLSEDVVNRNSVILSLIVVITGCISVISLKQKRS